MNKIMEEKIIVGIISGFILVITASFLNSKNISKSQKVILFCLIIFPPAQWILGIIFLNTNKKSTNENENENISKKKGPEVYEKEKSISTKMESRQVNNNIIANEDKFKEKRELLQKSLKMNLISQIEFDYKMKKIENEKEKIENKIKLHCETN